MISIVTPMYNAAAYIMDTIRCVQAQTYTDWEWILVDDHSTDDTLAVAEREAAADPQGRIRVLAMDANSGPARCRCAGVDASRGEYLAFLDADDVWLPKKLEHELAFLQQEGAVFVCHAYEFGDEQARGTGKAVHPPAVLTYEKALTRTVVFTSTVMLDMKKLSKEQAHMPDCRSEDTALWWRLMRTGYACHGLDEVLTIYRRPAQSLSSNKGRQIRNVWQLYRVQEGLSVPKSVVCLAGWAVRAVLRRI